MKNTIGLILITVVFHYGDIVKYPVPEFYKNICMGKGKVINFSNQISGDGFVYEVMDIQSGCPLHKDYYRDSELSLWKEGN